MNTETSKSKKQKYLRNQVIIFFSPKIWYSHTISLLCVIQEKSIYETTFFVLIKLAQWTLKQENVYERKKIHLHIEIELKTHET